jgi:hypothetical protein
VRRRIYVWLLGSALFGGCGAGAEAPIDEDTFCADQPFLTYNNFGKGFLTTHCQGCHASTTENRRNAPEDVTFDTLEQVNVQREDILAETLGEFPTMPPLGGVRQDDRDKLEIWLRCSGGL